MIQEIEFKCNYSNTILRGRFVRPDNIPSHSPLVIMLTGDGPKGSKSLSWVNMPPKLLEHGISSFLFDFAGLGYSDGERRKLTLTVGIENFKTAYNIIKNQEWVDKNRIGIFASSFGANVFLLQHEIANEVKLIGLKSPACFLPDAYLKEFGEELFEQWMEKGFVEGIGYEYEVLVDSFRYNTYESALKIKTPCLVTHGSKDEIVPLIQSKYLSRCLQGQKHLEIFENVGHGYSEEGAWDRMATLFVDWFKNNL